MQTNNYTQIIILIISISIYYIINCNVGIPEFQQLIRFIFPLVFIIGSILIPVSVAIGIAECNIVLILFGLVYTMLAIIMNIVIGGNW